ncbi:MAG: hypothetical protein ACM3TU_02445 [Bacillota bacterium]
MTDHPNNSIRSTVLEKIREGTVRRRPRAYFVARIVATVLVAILLLATSGVVISFILFSLHESGEQFLLGFGTRGVLTFLTLFPWTWGVGAVFLIIILDWLIRGFRFAYRIPLMPIFLGTVVASVILGIVLNLTPLHATLLREAHERQLPVVEDVYGHIFDSHERKGVYRGSVISVATSTFTLQHNDWDHDPDDGIFTIFVSPESGILLPRVGDKVFVLGTLEEGVIEAKNIQIFTSR